MATFDVSTPAWAQMITRLEAASIPMGGHLVTGQSLLVSEAVEHVLQTVASLPLHVEYVACCGSYPYMVSCYEPTDALQPRVMRPSDVFDAVRVGRHSACRAVARLHRRAVEADSGSCLVVVECITSASKSDLRFLRLLLTGGLPARSTVLVFVHAGGQEEVALDISPANARNLAVLHVCGGRLHFVDWHRLLETGVLTTDGQTGRYVAHRIVGAEHWVTYRSRNLAVFGQDELVDMGRRSRAQLGGAVLRELPISRAYPILAIGACTDDHRAQLSNYTPDLLVGIAPRSQDACDYFRRLRRQASISESHDLKSAADANYAASLLYREDRNAKRLYRVLSRSERRGSDAETVARMWMEVGQRLAKGTDQKSLDLALECFTAGRRSITRAPDVDALRRRSRLAAFANAEALIAFRRGDASAAERLVASAITLVDDIDESAEVTGQRALLEVHLGDISLRMRQDREAALAHFGRAHDLSRGAAQEVRDYVDPKYGETLLRTGRSEDAIAVLVGHLEQAVAATSRGNVPDPKALLAARLNLAQALFEEGRARSAAACYWCLLRHPGTLGSRALRAIAVNLERCHPEFDAALHCRMVRLLESHEAAADAAELVCVATAHR